MITIQIKKNNTEILTPKKITPGSSGFDVYSTVDCVLNPGEVKLIPLGFQVAIPEGYEIQVRPRSGLALKNGVTVANTPGTIDSDYRNDCGVILVNHGKQPFTVEKNMRIAQFVVQQVPQAEFVDVTALDETERKGGFGHTGK